MNPSLVNGLIGVALDHASQQVAVVVDAPQSQRDELRARLERTAAAAAGGSSPVKIVVQQACTDSSQLNDALSIIVDRDWHPRARAAAMAYSLDPYTSTILFTTPEFNRDVAEALVARVGSAVTVEYGAVSRDAGDRWPDVEPHWGGAHIWAPPYTNSDCTSGFTVRLPNGSIGSVTAGHCYQNGTTLESGTFFGKTDGNSGYPTWDMVRIHPYGETFARKLHTDPCCPSSRTVVGHGPASIGELVCKSGFTMKAICGLEVVDNNASLCAPTYCTHGLMKYTKNGETVGAGGDSGGPVYVRLHTSDAWIRGMHIGSDGDRKQRGYAERISVIKSHLGVEVIQN